ncbi:MAG TPA: excinuclease ABC subunit UvrA [Candidatus Protoclostridium stercorigallinarum]|uniref:UvrABC system protein A n=1 Tax=Candidatus Protoclostridium stercorigallinarum TaxID=2838741 RepID=A0A9D1Q118_9FIRM|nr:excinuclease ABC subunit UvrA [Candidatus Protoclostridium stercorigallinarum]
MAKYIRIRGARENNLKNIDLDIPHDSLTVFTGLSGSGKSSLAFDTIYAEGKRRYVESLSSYARQFLGIMNKPDVESIDGLSPAISIDQKTTSHNPRSTVGTVTEIYDYLRLLYAKAGDVYCYKCGKPVVQQSIDQIMDAVMSVPEGTRLMILAPIARGKKGEYKKELSGLKKQGYVRVKIDGEVRDLDEDIVLDKQVRHTISVIVDRIKMKEGIEKRLSDSLESALGLADGVVIVDADGTETLYNTKYACPDCGISVPEIEPKLFSFNSPFGACPECGGLGFKQVIDPELIYGDGSKSIREGAITVTGWNFDSAKTSMQMFTALSEKYGFSLDVPFRDLPEDIKHVLLYGDNSEIKMTLSSDNYTYSYKRKYEGVVTNLERRYRTGSSESVRREIEKYLRDLPCSACGGKRLRPEALAVKVGGKNIWELCAMPVGELAKFLSALTLGHSQSMIAAPILKEVNARLRFLCDVGLDYLALSRSATTLSGGEAQRIRLATQIGSGLTGVVYILDEPSIGLHQRDNDRLIKTLRSLRDLGNTLIVVEHDEDTMRAADFLVDIGPGAGVHGGEVIVAGTPDEVAACTNSITGDYLLGRKKIPVPEERRPFGERSIKIFGAKQNNLKNIDVEFPVGLITAVTGVSGSGKSSIVNQILYPAVSNRVNGSRLVEGKYDRIEGIEHLDKVICIDQSPIGRTPRSNPATYTGAFTQIRELFARTTDAQERGYGPGRFSFNVKSGRCEACEGDGVRRIEMHFMSDVYVPCEVCGGKRYNRETLQVKYRGKNIYDVLEMTVEEACSFFENQPGIYSKIKTLYDVGLGYIKLGQSATTLSGGEAQRVKLATELSKRATSGTLYVLDEPTTGLHSDDVAKLINILSRLVASGNTVVVIEHNLDVIKTADWIIDVGPEGGDAGGRIVTCGTPEQVARCEASYTGQFLKRMLK